MSRADEARARDWVAHLVDGGSTPWADWSGAAPAAPVPPGAQTSEWTGEPTSVRAGELPGAQHLEVLRRLNLAGTPSPSLVQRILSLDLPGRGQPPLDLVGAVEPSRFGPGAVDPAAVPLAELLRVAAALIAQDVAAAGPPPVPRRRITRPWRTRYRLAGDEELADPLRHHLVSAGRPPGGRNPRVLVLAAPADRMLADAWIRRCFDGGPFAWPRWCERVVLDGDLPLRADPYRLARRWAERVGRQRVHVVVDSAALPGLLGVRALPFTPAPAGAAPDLARHVATFLGLRVPPAERTDRMRRVLRPRLAGVAGPPVGVPEQYRSWLEARALRSVDGLRRGGFTVHGDLDTLLPDQASGGQVPDPGDTLDVALRLLLEEEA